MSTQIIPIPKVPLSFRVATGADIPFMDALQKQHSKQLGFFPRAQMEGYVAGGHVLVAESVASGQLPVASEGRESLVVGEGDGQRHLLATDNRQPATHFYLPSSFTPFLPATVLRGPLRVRALERVRCPRTGRLRR